MFSVTHDSNTFALELNNNLVKINRWIFQWKKSFNPHQKKKKEKEKKAQKSFLVENLKQHHILHYYINNVIQVISQKHLGIIIDTWLSFEKHLEAVLHKTNKTIGLIRRLHNLLPRSALITLYKAFVTPHLGYGDIL